MSIIKNVPLKWYSSMKKNTKIQIIIDIESQNFAIFDNFDNTCAINSVCTCA